MKSKDEARGKELIRESYHLLRAIKNGQYETFQSSMLMQVHNRLYEACKKLGIEVRDLAICVWRNRTITCDSPSTHWYKLRTRVTGRCDKHVLQPDPLNLFHIVEVTYDMAIAYQVMES